MSQTKTVVAINGDGIGREIVAAARRIVDAAVTKDNITIEWVEKKAGGEAIDAYGEPLPAETIKACETADAVLLGAVGGPQWDDVAPSIRPEKAILGLRKALGLFCNLRPVRIFKALQDYSPLKPELVQNVDFVIVRELTGGIYFGEREEAEGEGPNELAWDKEKRIIAMKLSASWMWPLKRRLNVAVRLPVWIKPMCWPPPAYGVRLPKRKRRLIRKLIWTICM